MSKKTTYDGAALWDLFSDPQREEPQKAMSLYELNSLVAGVVTLDMPGEYWVEAELSEAREVRGHCYMELVEKDERANTPIAKASAKCWASRWAMLRPMFERVTGERLHAGMKVMLKVKAQFHPAYGFSWIVSDINPEYTIGDLMRRRQEIVRQLKADGVFDLQRELSLPMFAQRIAVISSEGAAGYGDFCRQLSDNSRHYKYKVELFGAIMQGEGIERSVIEALDAIYDRTGDFDVVVIIRGGGATSDLSGFDTLALAENVANFPLPIITGIGHERDESVLDLVAHTHVKTPTAAAQLLIDNLAHTDSLLDNISQRIVRQMSARMDTERMRFASVAGRIPMLFSLVKTREWGRADRIGQRIATAIERRLTAASTRLSNISQKLETSVRHSVDNESHRLQLLAQRIEAQNPELLLSRGYSITTYDGRAVRDASTLPDGAIVETKVEKGCFKSVVAKSKK